ncbi:Hint domain-containing protein [Chachezhania antarctica]|uniref:Hint domain-containing protein n=1 Tax=Chachezhania antarctica TaxID=2340860 RepID=UPI0013CE7DD8|nr:Hint domain-containing protein [Chachezhania antarctica]|tara:strand:+ start:2269 stop:3237 length:969 start_codon:yes stop_codon:yes gene_type:complete
MSHDDVTLEVLPGRDFPSVVGAFEGEAPWTRDNIASGDIYRLRSHAQRVPMRIRALSGNDCQISETSPLGTPGAGLRIDGEVLVMSPSGTAVPIVVLTEGPESTDPATFLVPLLKVEASTDYTVVSSRPAYPGILSEIMDGGVGTAFAAGTRLTLANGLQIAVEALNVGDTLLTRDDGAQTVRWVGHSTRQAVGAMMPVTFAPGALNNAAPLTLAGAHRIFIYQRRGHLTPGHAEGLVHARDLVNGTTVRTHEGGYIDVVQIVLDRHEILFAEGVAVESLAVDPRTGRILPAQYRDALVDPAGLRGGNTLDRVDLLRLASVG